MANTIPHDFQTPKARVKALRKILRNPIKNFKEQCRSVILSEKGRLPDIPLEKLLSVPPKVQLENYLSRNGNVSPYELLCISSMVVEKKPKSLLEIGTFDGNTTLQMALNAPDDAKVQTLDLPPGETLTKEPVLNADIKFIVDIAKNRRKFEGTLAGEKVQQHFGDSTNFDFSLFGKVDFAFIDGGHTYECVKSDTENLLPILEEKAVIMWHDYTPFYPGVFRYLNELSEKLSLFHIEGTALAIAFFPQ